MMSPIAEKRGVGDLLFFLVAIVVGLITGFLGTALRFGDAKAHVWPDFVAGLAGERTALHLVIVGLTSALMVTAAVWLVRTFAPEAAGSGIQEIEGAMADEREIRWARILPVKFFGGLLSLGSGLVVGREGPTMHIGAAVAKAMSGWFNLSRLDLHALLAAGAGAGLAAAFNAPLAGVLFVLEETRRQFPHSFRSYSAVILATIASVILSSIIAGGEPLMKMDASAIPLNLLPAFAGLGVVLGLAGAAFNTSLVWSMDRAQALGNRFSFYLLPAVAGFAVGILLVLSPDATRGGETLSVELVAKNLPLVTIAGLVAVRFLMTMVSYSTGVPGGIFAPILGLATTIGLFYGAVLELAFALPPGASVALAAAAMGGLFAATVQAPLVGIILVAELTGAYSLVLPVMLTTVVARVVAVSLGTRPIYEVLLDRTLALSGRPAAER